jgi:hypothetical protein
MEFPGVLLLAITIVGILGAALAAGAALRHARTSVAQSIAVLTGAWLAAYGASLIVTSLASRERTLALGEAKRFCGFYLDCHMGVAVERVDTMAVIGDVATELRAGGTFYVVTLRVSNDAKRVPLHLVKPRVVVVDAEGFEYERFLDAERILPERQRSDLERSVDAGHSFTRTVVIDVPHGVREPRLRVTMGGRFHRVAELAIIGDEDAWLHAPAVHALVPGAGVSSASADSRR